MRYARGAACGWVLQWPHVAYKLIRAKAILAILPSSSQSAHPPSLPPNPTFSLSLALPLAAWLLPACLVPRLRFQNFLLQATFRAASVLCVCVCLRVWASARVCVTFSFRPYTSLTPPPPCFPQAPSFCCCLLPFLHLSLPIHPSPVILSRQSPYTRRVIRSNFS